MVRMLKVVTLVAAVLGAPAVTHGQGAPAAAQAGNVARVLVFNMRSGIAPDTLGNLARVAALARNNQADIVLLQEVDKGTARSRDYDQVQLLSTITNLRGTFGKQRDVQGGGQHGVAVLSRWEITQDSAASGRLGGVVTQVQAPFGRLSVVNVQLDSTLADAERVQRVRQIRDAATAAGGPVLVGGNFNADPGNPAVAAMSEGGLRDAWAQCGPNGERGYTYPAFAPARRIDYLFLGQGLRCVEAKVVESNASDHWALLVVVAPGM